MPEAREFDVKRIQEFTSPQKPSSSDSKNMRTDEQNKLVPIEPHLIEFSQTDVFDDFFISEDGTVTVVPPITGKPRTNKIQVIQLPFDQVMVNAQTDDLTQEALLFREGNPSIPVSQRDSQFHLGQGDMFLETPPVSPGDDPFVDNYMYVDALALEITTSNDFNFKLVTQRFVNNILFSTSSVFETDKPAITFTLEAITQISVIADADRFFLYIICIFKDVPNPTLNGYVLAVKTNFESGVILSSAVTEYGSTGGRDFQVAVGIIDDTDQTLYIETLGGNKHIIDKTTLVLDIDPGATTGSPIANFYTKQIFAMYSPDRFIERKSIAAIQGGRDSVPVEFDVIYLAISFQFRNKNFSPIMSQFLGAYNGVDTQSVTIQFNQADITEINSEFNLTDIKSANSEITFGAVHGLNVDDEVVFLTEDGGIPVFTTVAAVQSTTIIRLASSVGNNNTTPTTAYCHKVNSKVLSVWENMESVFLWGTDSNTIGDYFFMGEFILPTSYPISNEITINYTAIGSESFKDRTGLDISDILSSEFFFRFMEKNNFRSFFTGLATSSDTEKSLKTLAVYIDTTPLAISATADGAQIDDITFPTGLSKLQNLFVVFDEKDAVLTDGLTVQRRFLNHGTTNYNAIASTDNLLFYVRRDGFFIMAYDGVKFFSEPFFGRDIFKDYTDLEFKQISGAIDVEFRRYIASDPKTNKLFCFDIDTLMPIEAGVDFIGIGGIVPIKLQQYNSKVYGLFTVEEAVTTTLGASPASIIYKENAIIKLFSGDVDDSLVTAQFTFLTTVTYSNRPTRRVYTNNLRFAERRHKFARYLIIKYTSDKDVILTINKFNRGAASLMLTETLPIASNEDNRIRIRLVNPIVDYLNLHFDTDGVFKLIGIDYD